MHGDFLSTEVGFLKGVGPQRAEILKKEFDISTFQDLLTYYPYRYVDRTRIYRISEVNDQMPYIQVKGRITGVKSAGKHRTTRLVAELRDETGTLELVWFHSISYMREFLATSKEIIAFGKPTRYQGRLNIVHPDMEPAAEAHETLGKTLQAFYLATEKSKLKRIDSRALLRFQRTLYERLSKERVPETLPSSLIEELKLSDLKPALMNIHFPPDEQVLAKARFRLKFEEFFFLQLHLLQMKLVRTERNDGRKFSRVGEAFNTFYRKRLPFMLTGAQKKVLREIRRDTGSGKQMNRLLQGDVGSGKTLVALMSMLLALDNGCQACLMAPTELLAFQHFETITRFTAGMDLQIALLTGSTTAAKRKSILRALADGNLHILIGTHALIEEAVQFAALGLCVIDEQHRFGVKQRARLWNREAIPPHVLVMTATPIPRTLAMTLYGDLDVSVIDELPPGRKPVLTRHVFETKRLRLNGLIRERIRAGQQVYVVYPLIEESEKLDYKNLVEGYEAVCRDFPAPDYRTSIVHGRLKPAERDAEMKRFVEGKTQIMVATTVIEVGVDVPNATVMVIESAERFGLSQLHQLRGRVGRGSDASCCILVTGHKLSADARERMHTMVRTNDGFEIAETDLRLRGPGDLQGTQQSGLVGLRLADLAKDASILELARSAAFRILEKDPHLVLPENQTIRKKLYASKPDAIQWERIS